MFFYLSIVCFVFSASVFAASGEVAGAGSPNVGRASVMSSEGQIGAAADLHRTGVSAAAANMDCTKCHEHEHYICAAPGKAAHHTLANRALPSKIDDRAFDSREFLHSGVKYLFYKEGGECKVSAEDLKSGKKSFYTAKMAIGLDPLIQYVVEGKNGAYQVLSAAYDPKKDEFFDVFNNEPRAPGDWGHWLSGGMNWNSNCAYCHTTDFRKNFKVGDNSYHSGFSAHGVSCLQCHDALPKDCKHSELSELAERPSPAERMYACAVCHSRREQLKDEKFKAGSDFYDYFRPILPVQDGIYYPDGKVRDENFMFSSFMMCRQYQAGLTCLDCHDRHALKTVRPVDKNELCLNCHAPAARNFKNAPTIIPEAHSFHKGNDGNLCVNCHMPKTIYMARDSRYDHGFTSPDPVLTREAGVPNACSQCHEKIDAGKLGRNLDWLIENFEKWYGSERFLRKRARSMAVARAHAGDVSEALKAELLKALEREDNDAWKSALLSLLTPWSGDAAVSETAVRYLADKNPLVRSSAVGLLNGQTDSEKLSELALNDPSALVRIDSAFSLGKAIPKNSAAYSELKEYLNFNSDRPFGALKHADFELRAGNPKNAKKLAESALEMERNNPAIDREVGIILFRGGFAEDSLKILKNAAQKYPENADVSYALALLHAELGDAGSALAELERTVRIDPGFVRAWYNLSIAQLQSGKLDGALKSIDTAIRLSPDSAELYNVKNFILSRKNK